MSVWKKEKERVCLHLFSEKHTNVLPCSVRANIIGICGESHLLSECWDLILSLHAFSLNSWTILIAPSVKIFQE